MKHLKLTLIALVALIILSCAPKRGEIVLLCTNDMHGRIDNFPKVAAYYDSVKATNRSTFLFCSGDMFSGNPLVDQYPEKGYPIIDIMNKTGFELCAPGNHEFDFGQDVLNARREQASFPFVSANVNPGESASLKALEPYKIYETGGVKMAVLGLVEVGSGGTPSTHPDRVKGIAFGNPIETAKEYRRLRDNEVFVGLFHTGIEADLLIADAVPELDVILGGHSHTKIDTGIMRNGVLITQAGAHLHYLGETRITLKDGKVVKRTNRLLDLDKMTKEDAEVKALVEKYKAEDQASRVIGRARRELAGKEQLGQLMTKAIVEELGVDMAFQNSGGIRIPSIPQGDITLNTIYSLDPFGNEVITIKMSYEEIASLLQGTARYSTLPDLYAWGMSYRMEVDADKQITLFEMFDSSGKALDKDREYSVGMNSYIYSKYKFLHKDPGASAGVTSAQTLIDYIEKIKEIE
jgi:2',3'-cyclic-nucleotide 2'-phosphodiesterase (5'-nucleotidase family)